MRPGGLTFTERTDEAGEIEVTVPTTCFLPGTRMVFSATLVGENLSAKNEALVAASSLVVKVLESPQVVLAGDPFEVRPKALDAEGNPSAPTSRSKSCNC